MNNTQTNASSPMLRLMAPLAQAIRMPLWMLATLAITLSGCSDKQPPTDVAGNSAVEASDDGTSEEEATAAREPANTESADQTAENSQADNDAESASASTSIEADKGNASSSDTSPNISGEAFRLAAYEGRLETVRRAVESGVDVNATDDAQSLTALHMAAYNGHSETVKYLLEHGAKIDARDREGKTPLIHASTGPFPETVKVLIESGADINAKESTESFTPLMMAAGLGEAEVVRVLLEEGADKDAADDDDEKAIDHARNSGHDAIVEILQ